MTKLQHDQAMQPGRTQLLRIDATAFAFALLVLALSGCGSKSHSSASTARSEVTAAASSTRPTSRSSTSGSTTTPPGQAVDSSTPATGGSGPSQSAPTLPPQLTTPPANGSSPNLTNGQWTEAAAAYDALPSVDPCVPDTYQQAFYAIAFPNIPSSEAQGMAYIRAMIAQLRLYFRSMRTVNATAADQALHHIDVAEGALNGPYPQNIESFLTALAGDGAGATGDTNFSEGLQSRCGKQ